MLYKARLLDILTLPPIKAARLGWRAFNRAAVLPRMIAHPTPIRIAELIGKEVGELGCPKLPMISRYFKRVAAGWICGYP